MNTKHLKAVAVGTSACLALSALAQSSTGYGDEEVRAAGVKTLRKFLDANCLRGDDPDRKACYRVQAGLLPPLDLSRREEFGESYDPKKYLECRLESMEAGGHCDIYRLRRKKYPEYWPNPNLPRPVIADGDKKVYRPGMSSEEYFKALCEAEAGEFIYKTVEDVEAVYQIRPREDPAGAYRVGQDRYVLEAPYFFDGHMLNAQAYLHGPGKFPIFEKPNLSTKLERLNPLYLRYVGYMSEGSIKLRDSVIERWKSAEPTAVSELRSHYGYYWYGIRRQMDRELAVAGGEMVVVDLRTNEVMGVMRGFALGVSKKWGKGYSPTGISWNAGGVCPQRGDPPYMPSIRFLMRVLKPKTIPIKGE